MEKVIRRKASQIGLWVVLSILTSSQAVLGAVTPKGRLRNIPGLKDFRPRLMLKRVAPEVVAPEQLAQGLRAVREQTGETPLTDAELTRLVEEGMREQREAADLTKASLLMDKIFNRSELGAELQGGIARKVLAQAFGTVDEQLVNWVEGRRISWVEVAKEEGKSETELVLIIPKNKIEGFKPFPEVVLIHETSDGIQVFDGEMHREALNPLPSQSIN